MSLFTSSAPGSRVSVAYLLAIAILLLILGGLLSLHEHGTLAMSDVPWARGASASKSIAKDNGKFSWDLVRIRLGSLTSVIADSTFYYS